MQTSHKTKKISLCLVFTLILIATPLLASANNGLPKLMDLGAHKCIPCIKMAPILEELTTEYQGIFDVEFVDVWEAESRKKAVEYKIKKIPTQIFFAADGTELWRHEGFFSKEEILQKWQDLGFTFSPSAS